MHNTKLLGVFLARSTTATLTNERTAQDLGASGQSNSHWGDSGGAIADGIDVGDGCGIIEGGASEPDVALAVGSDSLQVAKTGANRDDGADGGGGTIGDGEDLRSTNS